MYKSSAKLDASCVTMPQRELLLIKSNKYCTRSSLSPALFLYFAPHPPSQFIHINSNFICARCIKADCICRIIMLLFSQRQRHCESRALTPTVALLPVAHLLRPPLLPLRVAAHPSASHSKHRCYLPLLCLVLCCRIRYVYYYCVCCCCICCS